MLTQIKDSFDSSYEFVVTKEVADRKAMVKVYVQYFIHWVKHEGFIWYIGLMENSHNYEKDKYKSTIKAVSQPPLNQLTELLKPMTLQTYWVLHCQESAILFPDLCHLFVIVLMKYKHQSYCCNENEVNAFERLVKKIALRKQLSS